MDVATIKDYLLACLKVDVGLLTNVFSNWNQLLHDMCRLDCTYYWSLLSFLQLLSEADDS